MTVPDHSSYNEGSDEEEMRRPKNYYNYQLAGIVVHSGSSDSGHYYSFIRRREVAPPSSIFRNRKSQSPPPQQLRGSSPSASASTLGFSFQKASLSSWFKFNDGTIETFSPSQIPDKCFGGTYTSSEWDAKSQCWKVFR
jgi:hypothetical protein